MYSSEQLSHIAALFGLSLTDCQELAVGSKWMGRRYVATSGSARFFLKVRSEWWPAEQAEMVCSLIQQLHSRGFPVPELRLTTEENPFAVWEDHICECHEYVEG